MDYFYGGVCPIKKTKNTEKVKVLKAVLKTAQKNEKNKKERKKLKMIKPENKYYKTEYVRKNPKNKYALTAKQAIEKLNKIHRLLC
jgi:hypothetical protein